MRGDSNRDGDEDAATPAGTQRLDRWLWFARIVKSRTLAAQLVAEGKVRVNRTRVSKPAQAVRSDDVLTIALRGQVRVLRILAPGVRRGPPSEAQRLYERALAIREKVLGPEHPEVDAWLATHGQ